MSTASHCLSRVLTVVLTLAIMALAGTAMAETDTLSTIKSAGVLKVAVPQDFPPFGSVGPDMKPVGYDIDMAAHIAKALGVKLTLVPVSSTNRIPYLTTGKVDLVISSLGKNAERAAVIDFSDAYAPFFNGVFGPAGAAIAGPADLAGKSVAVTRGSIEDLELTKIAPATVSIMRFEDNSGTASAYQSGQVELIATGNVVAASLNGKNPAKKLEAKFLIKNSPCYIGVAKGQKPLLDAVNAIIASARKDGSLDAISETWLHASLPAEM